jgi:hypothetical protein
MNRLRHAFSFLVAIALLGLPISARAQSAQAWSAQGSVLAANQSLNGSTVTGVGFEAQLRYTPSAWSYGGGYQYSTYTSGGQNLTLTGVFVEPRYAWDFGSDRVFYYLAGRAALLHESTTLAFNGQGINASSAGFALGLGGGLLVKMTKTVNLDFGAAIVSESLSDASGNGYSVTFKTITGYLVKAGVSFGFSHDK